MKQIDTERWEQISLICEGDYMVHNYMYKSFTYVFENVIYHFTILISLAQKENQLAGKFLQPDRGFF